jgi:putative lipoprotein (rSAM/lipoprotein system)
MKRKLTYILLLLTLLPTAGCGNIVLMDDDGLQALRKAKISSKVISIEGKVTDEEGTPLEGISVIVIGRFLRDSQTYYGQNYQELDTLSTDANGSYRMAERTVSPAFTDLQLNAFDSNGRYKDASIFVRDIQAGAVAPTITLLKK